MGAQQRVHRPVECDFTGDFPELLERFKEAVGLTLRFSKYISCQTVFCKRPFDTIYKKCYIMSHDR